MTHGQSTKPHNTHKMSKLVIEQTIGYGYIMLTNNITNEIFRIEQSGDTGRFYVSSDKGYNCRDIEEHKSICQAVRACIKTIKNSI